MRSMPRTIRFQLGEPGVIENEHDNVGGTRWRHRSGRTRFGTPRSPDILQVMTPELSAEISSTPGVLNDAGVVDKAAPKRRRTSRRDAILQAAIDLFAKGGSRGTCIAAIADRIGVTPAAVIHHFKTKDGLLREVVGEIERRRPALVDFEPSGPDVLRAIGRWGHIIESDPELANLTRLSTVMVAESLDPDHPSHQYFIDRSRSFRSVVAEHISRGIDEGWIRADVNPDTLAVVVVGAMYGIQLQWFQDPERAAISTSIDVLMEVLIEALATPTVNPMSASS